MSDTRTLSPFRIIPHPKRIDYSQIAFLGLAKDQRQNCYRAVYREFTPAKSDVESNVRYQKYDLDFNLVGDSRLLMKNTEDPRIFVWKNNFYCSTVSFLDNEFKQYVLEIRTGKKFQLSHSLKYAGKNWMPAPNGEELYFIRSVDPLCLLKVDKNWFCETVIDTEYPLYIGQYRGGSAARISSDKIFGYGHRTIDVPVDHKPFIYEIDMQSKSISFDNINIDGFEQDKIIDPTSMIDDYVVCSCAKTTWWEEQEIQTKICKLSN